MAQKRDRVSKKAPAATGSLSRARAFREEFFSETSSGSDSDGTRGQVTSRGTLKHKRGRKPKRPRTADQQPPEMSDGDIGDNEEQAVAKKTMPASLVDSNDGPLLQINIAELIANSNLTPNGVFRLAGLKFNNTIPSGKQTEGKQPASFINLPPELAEPIYRELFVTQQDPIMFTSRKGFSRSSQFLRTCRQIYEQGRRVLYGQNSFHFGRTNDTRGTYYDEEWKEIGYKDVRRFFNDIGNHNVAYLKYISIDFDDALPSLTPGLNHEQRRYTHDSILIEVLRTLGKHSKLELFIARFGGRSSLSNADHHFLEAICSIRCVEFSREVTLGLDRLDIGVSDSIKKLVTIPPPLVTNADKNKNKYAPKMFRDKGRFVGPVSIW